MKFIGLVLYRVVLLGREECFVHDYREKELKRVKRERMTLLPLCGIKGKVELWLFSY